MNPIDTRAPTSTRLALLGIGFDRKSSFMGGAALAPAKIREQLFCDSGNLTTEAGLDLSAPGCWSDRGDLDLDGVEEASRAIAEIEARASAALEQGDRLLALGGDHSITYPLVEAHFRRYGALDIVHFDAHPDLYEDFEGDRLSHACPFARILERGFARRLVQVGIRGANAHQREQADRYGVETLPAWGLQPERLTTLAGPIYLSLDLDVLDPAFAPGISHREPGGLSSRQLLDLIKTIPRQVIGADLVELNPTRDRDGLAARVAGKLAKEMLGLLHESLSFQA